MNAARIASAAGQIADLTAALEWLREHGARLDPRDKDAFGVHVALNACSALPGAKQASAQLSAMAKLLAPVMVANAITNAENTIEILRQQIADEVAQK